MLTTWLDDSWVKVDFIPGLTMIFPASPGLTVPVSVWRWFLFTIDMMTNELCPGGTRVTSDVKGGENVLIFCQISLKTKSSPRFSHHHNSVIEFPGPAAITRLTLELTFPNFARSLRNIQIEKFTFLDTDHRQSLTMDEDWMFGCKMLGTGW